MKKYHFLLLLLAASAIAQPKKYQSLLWEISGNGLAKKSYLYGSMHVSEKVSYHLSDAFFKHLLASDYVANESDPSTWIGLYDVMGTPAYQNYMYASNGFYSQFYQQPITREDLYPLFVSNNNIMNNLLFRTNENQKDYQEDTYLDMFIYQTGKKYKKQVVGLENAKTSMLSIMGAEMGNLTPREENMQAIMKLLKDKSFNQALLDYYRDKNLDMLDSLYTLATPDGYFKALILDRNQVMAKSIDSIAKKGSLFAAVGAAHLPGKNGVIEILRKKGYTVTPVVDAYTQQGRNIKKQIDEYFIKPEFETRATADGMIRLPMHAQPIFSSDNIDTPDLANGGIVNLKRIPLRDYLRKDEMAFSANTLDSLFYENIPGDILEKKYFTDDNYTGYDIKSRTKTGNTQHYKYFITPLEVICVSMSGNGNYVRQYENEIFNNIKLKKNTTGWETVTPAKGGFSVNVPSYFTLYGNRDSSNPENIELNAWDEIEKAWYFLTEKTLSDNSQLEETAFELKRMQDEFYTQFDATTSVKEIARSPNSYESQSKIGNREIRLKTVISGQKYYMLGTVKASAQSTEKFFRSFAIQPFKYESQTRKFTDSLGRFSIEIPEKQNEKLFWKINSPKSFVNPYDTEMENKFERFEKQFSFTSASGKNVTLSAWESHRYDYAKNRDSLMVNLKKKIYEDFDQFDADENSATVDIDNVTVAAYIADPRQSSGQIPDSSWDAVFEANSNSKKKADLVNLTSEKENYDDARKLYTLDVMAQKQNSQQAVKYKVFMQDGNIWWLRALVEKDYRNNDVFIEKIADSFTPQDGKHNFSIFDKKTKLFFEDARSENDTIRFSALQSAYMVDFEKEDLPQLKTFLTTFNFRADETQAITTLLEKIGRINDPEVIPFLESCYKKDDVNTAMQLSVIRGLAKQKSKAAYKKIIELLEYDLPLSNNRYEISSLFQVFNADPENSKALFPEIFQFYGVKEYQEPIVSFASELFKQKQVNPSKGKSYRKLLLTDAKLEYKRVAAWKSKSSDGKDDEYFTSSPAEELKSYCILLYPFKKEKAVAQWFEKVEKLEIAEINLELVRLDLTNGNMPNPAIVSKLFADPKTKFTTYRLLLDNKKDVPKWTDEEIALAAVNTAGTGNNLSGDIQLVKRTEVTKDGESISIFFYNAKPKEKIQPFAASENSLVAVAFINAKGNINPKAWKIVGVSPIADLTNLDAECETIIDRLQNGSHSRASFGKQKDNGFPSYLEEEF
ncbi:TraB/GumN family protein [Flavobacterium sp.]|uniref:TraB/GumN family protein n=1 Tax=Flavobacterium sp. TaxID=239 RepID=UPI0025BE1F6E|nr:TraB/GumN family protein [Flavobacterium sp.]